MLSSPTSARRCRRAVRSEALTGKPELVNEDAEGAGWLYKIKLAKPSELDTLLDREAYVAYVRERG